MHLSRQAQICDDMLVVLECGIEIREKKYSFQIRAIVCDAPDRAFVLNTLQHSGYNSCTKCVISGKRVNCRITFPGVDHKRRTNESFRNRIHPTHHHSIDPILLESLPIDCVKNVVIDVMHAGWLGVTKRL